MNRVSAGMHRVGVDLHCPQTSQNSTGTTRGLVREICCTDVRRHCPCTGTGNVTVRRSYWYYQGTGTGDLLY
jgi:hypothetical protein